MNTVRNQLFSALLLAATLLIWESSVRFFGIPSFILPAPSRIAYALFNGITSGLYLRHLWATLLEVTGGFVLGCAAGLLLGIGIALNRFFSYFMRPYVVMFQSMPKVALTPLIVLWFGLGPSSKIVTAALVAFFPVMVNTISGLRAADEDRINLIRSLGGSELQIFWKLQLPNSMPFVMAGFEVALTLALTGTVVAEFLGSETGLGMLMESMNYSMDVAGSFSILFVLAALGLTLNAALGLIKAKVLFWDTQSTPTKERQPASKITSSEVAA